jgi:hypothetical protein
MDGNTQGKNHPPQAGAYPEECAPAWQEKKIFKCLLFCPGRAGRNLSTSTGSCPATMRNSSKNSESKLKPPFFDRRARCNQCRTHGPVQFHSYEYTIQKWPVHEIRNLGAKKIGLSLTPFEPLSMPFKNPKHLANPKITSPLL